MIYYTPEGMLGDYEEEEKEDPKVEVNSVCFALFYTATWRMQMKIDGVLFEEGSEKDKQHTQDECNAWARAIISGNRTRLKTLGVNIDNVYRSFGGNPSDLHYYI